VVTRSKNLLQEAIQVKFRRFRNFLGYARGFVIRHNPLKAASKNITSALKDMLTINKKLKMSQYRLNYHQNQLHKMESLIAKNNEHTFLRGRNLNEVR